MRLLRLPAVLLVCTALLAAAPVASSKLTQTQLAETVPATVYFSGKVAPTQVRNSAGVRSGNGQLTEFFLVDTGGYSTAIRDRYQFYLLSDVALEIGGKPLPAGAYGAGFLPDLGLLVMDLGGKELFHVPIQHDPALKRPRPLEVLVDSASGESKLYLGRDFVPFIQKP